MNKPTKLQQALIEEKEEILNELSKAIDHKTRDRLLWLNAILNNIGQSVTSYNELKRSVKSDE